MNVRTVFTLLVVATLTSGSRAVAQFTVPTGISLGIGANVTSLTGEDFERASTGPGFRVFLRGTHPGGFQFGGGLELSWIPIDARPDRMTMLSVYVEPRYALRSGPVIPFVGAQLGWIRQSVDIPGFDTSGSGTRIGGVAGVDLQVGPRTTLEIGVRYDFISIKEAALGTGEIDSNGGMLQLNGGFIISLGPDVVRQQRERRNRR